jgi:hypothetical protein
LPHRRGVSKPRSRQIAGSRLRVNRTIPFWAVSNRSVMSIVLIIVASGVAKLGQSDAGGLVVRSTAGSNRVKHTNSNKAKGSSCSSERHRPRRLPRHRLLRQALHPPQRLLLLPA